MKCVKEYRAALAKFDAANRQLSLARDRTEAAAAEERRCEVAFREAHESLRNATVTFNDALRRVKS